MPESADHICVIGTGVTGLTTAICLAESGFRVTLISGRSSSETTSSVAAAFWYPFAVKGYARHWASSTYHIFRSLASEPDSGISLGIPAREYLHSPHSSHDQLLEGFWWHDLPGTKFECLPGAQFQFPAADRLGEITFSAQVTFTVPVLDMPKYLRFLEGWLRRLNVTMETRWVSSARELFRSSTYRPAAVINCCGYGAPQFLDQNLRKCSIRPVAGQLAFGTCNGIDEVVFIHTGAFSSELLYIVPRGGKVVLGGSFTDLQQYSAQSPLPTRNEFLDLQIIDRCKVIEPALRNFQLQESRVGIRGVADEIVVEKDQRVKGLFHNVGHGGGGISLSWGCAQKTVELVREYLRSNRHL